MNRAGPSSSSSDTTQFGFKRDSEQYSNSRLTPLRDCLLYDHINRLGRFDDTSRRDVIHNLFKCIKEWDDVWTRGPDPGTGGPITRHPDYTKQDLKLDSYGNKVHQPVSALQQLVDEARELSDVPPVKRQRRGRRCGRIIPRTHKFYGCKTCFRDQSNVICVDCFDHQEHEGHDILFVHNYNFATVCDCGEMDQYKSPELHSCLRHPATSDVTPPFDPKYTDSQDVPQDFIQTLHDTFSLCIEFIIGTLQIALPASEWGVLPKDLTEMRSFYNQDWTAFPRHWSKDIPWAVSIYTDDKHNEPEIVRQVEHAMGVNWHEAFNIVRQMDGYGRHTLLVTQDASLAFFTANMLQQIDVQVTLRHAYDAYREDMAATLIEWISDICECHVAGDPDLTTNVLAAVLQETRTTDSQVAPDLQLAEHGVYEYPDGSRGREPHRESLPGRQTTAPTTLRLDWLWLTDNRLWKRPKLQMRAIYSRVMSIHPSCLEFATHRFAVQYLNIVQNYLRGDHEADTSLSQFLSFAMCARGAPLAKACQETRMLEQMIDVIMAWYRQAYEDIEGDYNILLPMKPVESIRVTGEVARTRLLKALPIIQKKAAALLLQFRHILSFKEVAHVVRRDHQLVSRMLPLLALFDGLQPQKRAIEAHVQYEFDHAKGFGLLGDVAQAVRAFGECFVGADLMALRNAIGITAQRIRQNEWLVTTVMDAKYFSQPRFTRSNGVLHRHGAPAFPPDGMEVIEIASHLGTALSFHNYTHYLLGWLIKALAASVDYSAPKQTRFPELLKQCIATASNALRTEKEEHRSLSVLINQPLNKYVMIQQIRDHRWKRNGRDIRDQVDWYLDGTRRDVGFDLEFVILQSALCFMGPLKFIRTAIMKFQLDRFFQEHENPLELWLHRTTAAPLVISSVLEDFLWMIIWLVTDTDQVMHRSTQELARQDFIQYLAIGPHSYLELSRIVPDRVNERIDISAILREVADFRAPTETTSGVYSLKPEFYKEVNILWRHYSRNQRATVIPIASKEIFKYVSQEHPSLDVAKWFLKPLLPQVPPASQGFSNLTEIFHDGIAARIAHYIVMHCMLMDDETAFAKVKNEDLPRLDQLFDLVLHFSTIAIGINRPAFTGEAILGSPFECPETVDKANSLLQNLWYIYVSDKPVWAPYLLRVEYILRRMVKLITKADPTIQDEFDQTNKARGKRFRTTAPVPDEKFKDAGAARQKQVLAEFAKKQAAFAALMAEGDDEDEDMDAPEVQANDNTSFGPCLVCQNPVTADDIGGLLALFQPSRLIREVHGGQEYFEKSLTVHSNLDDAVPHNAPGVWTKETDHESFQKTDAHPSSDHRFGVYVSTCGHLMHEACLLGYTDQTMMRHTHQPARNQPENAQRGEFVCPFCHSVGNFLLPIDFVGPNQNPTFRVDSNGCPIPLLDHIRAISQEGLKGVNDSSKVWQNHDHDGRLKCWFSDGEFQRAMHTRKTRKKDMRGLHRLIDTFRSLFRAVGDQSTILRESSLPMYLPEDLVGYTVSVLEIQQRGIARGPGQQTVVDQVPETARKLVKKLIEEMRLELDGCFGIQDTRPALRVCLFARFLPDWYRASALAMPLLARDPLSMVIECAAIAPDLLHPVIIMSYYAEVCRALLAIASILRRCVSSWHLQDAPESKNPFTFYHDPHGESAKTIFGDFTGTAAKLLRDAAPYNDINLVLSSAPPPLLAKLLYMYTLPFLRRAAIVFYTIHGSYPMQDTSAHLDDGCEYSRLASRMHIPSLKSVLEERTSPEAQMVSRWLTHWSVAGRHVPQIDVAEPYELLSLPTTHSDMIVYQHLKKCLVCRRVPANPALCLLCGTLVCLAGDCCAEAEQGECNIHMRQCGAAVGMFVDVRRWSLLLLYAGSGTWHPMPYLDEHGDPDWGGQKKSHVLYMEGNRFEEIRKNIWLGHAIPHIVARKLEQTQDHGGWEML